MSAMPRCVVLMLLACPAGAYAEAPGSARVFANPPKLETRRPPAAMERGLDLDVAYIRSAIWNPATRRFDPVRLRGYQGKGMDPGTPFVAPTLEVVPGSTVRVTLNNRLPADPGCTGWKEDVNKPHCFNGTNLHTHGLWVNPSGNGDNVLISINPGVRFQYEYNIPPDHPAGTFWYHPHRHGSTALQVSSGMVGALIVRGNRPPSPTTNGDLDTLLRPTPRQAFTERVLVLQQIQYACRDAGGKVKTVSATDKSYRCDPGDTGEIDGYDLFGPGSWPESGRYTSVNGHVLPTFQGARSGQIERWRVIHGGVRDTIALQFRKLGGPAPAAAPMKAAEHDAFVGNSCTGDALPYHLVAADGLTTATAIRTDVAVLQPGYRWDALVVFPEPGRYCVIDAATPASASVGQSAPSRQLLGFVAVGQAGEVRGDIGDFVMRELSAAAGRNMPRDVRPAVISDLEHGLKLSRFVPHADVEDREVTGAQQLLFNIDVSSGNAVFQVNGNPYDPARIDRVLSVGGVDEWTLRSAFVSHPFHIHVNPFQVVKVLDPQGKDVSLPDAVDSAGGAPDPQYRALKGVWKDTLWVKNLVPPGKPPGQYTLVVRTRYQRYIGDFVLHCHILDHEDQGMMQNVRIALPDGAGGTSQGHH